VFRWTRHANETDNSSEMCLNAPTPGTILVRKDMGTIQALCQAIARSVSADPGIGFGLLGLPARRSPSITSDEADRFLNLTLNIFATVFGFVRTKQHQNGWLMEGCGASMPAKHWGRKRCQKKDRTENKPTETVTSTLNERVFEKESIGMVQKC